MCTKTHKCYYVKYLKNKEYTGYIFAETRGKAISHTLLALKEVGFRRANFVDIKATREKELDKYFIEPYKVFDLDQVYSGGR